MLARIVRPLVETQIRLLANSNTTRQTLIETIIRWLGYLGVQAEVTELCTNDQRIRVTLNVAQPDQCDPQDWQKIIDHLGLKCQIGALSNAEGGLVQMTESQQIQLARMLAYILQAGQPDERITWENAANLLLNLNLEEPLLSMIQSALKVPQSVQLVEKIDEDVAAYAFPLAVQLSWLDQKVTVQENEALVSLLKVIE